jgi:hypothetical protein
MAARASNTWPMKKSYSRMPAKAPAIWATQYGITLRQSNFRATAKASVTAGLKCAPLIPPET